MPKYAVTITATVTKTLEVEASNEQEATELAHQLFTVQCDGDDERYSEETDKIEVIK